MSCAEGGDKEMDYSACGYTQGVSFSEVSRWCLNDEAQQTCTDDISLHSSSSSGAGRAPLRPTFCIVGGHG